MKKAQRSVSAIIAVMLLTAIVFGRGGQKDEKDAPDPLIKAARFLEEKPFDKYDAMVKEQPKARNAFLDDLSSKRGAGLLAKYVAENNCKDKK